MATGIIILLAVSAAIILGFEAERAIMLKNEIENARKSYTGRATAQILSVTEKRAGRSRHYYYPEFLFVVENKAYGANQLIFSDTSNTFRAGTWVTVRYRTDNPDDFMPENDEALWKMASDTFQTDCFLIVLLVAAALASPLLL